MLPSRIFFDNFLDEMDFKSNDLRCKCDIYEEDGVYHILMDAPGFKKEDIIVEFEKGNLRIVLEHKEEEKDNRKYVRRERISMSKYERSFYLGEVLEDEIKAEFKDGILKISVPKVSKEEPTKKIVNID